jgi:hypothetical protein
MSYELANQSTSLGQFASGKGYADFIAALNSLDYPALVSLVRTGQSSALEQCRAELLQLIQSSTDPDVKSVAIAIFKLSQNQEVIVITQGLQ